jgi:hypothetical protein
MRQYIGITALLFAAALGTQVAEAAPITYDMTFSLQVGTPAPTGGSFTYDAATTTFTNFTVMWDGLAWDLTNSANNPDISSPAPPCLGGLTGAAASFFVLSHGCFHAGPGPSNSWFGNPQFGQPGFERFRFLTLGTNGDTTQIEIHTTQADSSGVQGGGQWSVTTATPEPSTAISLLVVLLSVALGAEYVVRRVNTMA